MEQWRLPTSLNLSGVDWQIRTDFRVIIDILAGFNDPDLEDDDKWIVALTILYVDFDRMPAELYTDACIKAKEFIDMGAEEPSDRHRPQARLMDWEQDASCIIPAVNRVIGSEVRAMEHLHWWTFLGAYMEIGECAFSTIVRIRSKKAKGQRLEKWEQDFYRDNHIALKHRYSEEELEEQRLLEEKFG